MLHKNIFENGKILKDLINKQIKGNFMNIICLSI